MQRQLSFPQPLEALTCPFHCTAGQYCQGLGEGVGKHWWQLLQNPTGFSPAQPGPTSPCTGREFPVKRTTPGLKQAMMHAEISDALASLPSLSSHLKPGCPWPMIPTLARPLLHNRGAGKESALLAGTAGCPINSKSNWKVMAAPSGTSSFLLGVCCSFPGSSSRGRSAPAMLQVLKAPGVDAQHHSVLTSQLFKVYAHTVAHPLQHLTIF